MEVLDEVKEEMGALAYKQPETNWAGGDYEQGESDANQAHGLMLDEVREAANDLAQMSSVMGAADSLPEISASAQNEASSESSPTVFGDESTQDEEREAEETVMALLQSIEQAATVDDLEKIHEHFTAHSQLLKGKLAVLKSRELIEAYLSMTATLNAIRRTIENARLQNVTQINGRQIAEQISTRLAATQQAVRQTAQRMLESTMLVAQQQMLQQSMRMQESMRNAMQGQLAQQQGQQSNLAAERARAAMQELAHKLSQSQEAMRRAQEFMKLARNLQQQQQVIARLNQIMKSINLQTTIASVQQQLSALRTQLQQTQQQVSRDAATREQATKQAVVTQQLSAQLAELNTAVQQQQQLQRFFELQKNAEQMTNLNVRIQESARQFEAVMQQQASQRANDNARQGTEAARQGAEGARIFQLGDIAQKQVEAAARQQYGVDLNPATKGITQDIQQQQQGKKAAELQQESLKEGKLAQDRMQGEKLKAADKNAADAKLQADKSQLEIMDRVRARQAEQLKEADKVNDATATKLRPNEIKGKCQPCTKCGQCGTDDLIKSGNATAADITQNNANRAQRQMQEKMTETRIKTMETEGARLSNMFKQMATPVQPTPVVDVNGYQAPPAPALLNKS